MPPARGRLPDGLQRRSLEALPPATSIRSSTAMRRMAAAGFCRRRRNSLMSSSSLWSLRGKGMAALTAWSLNKKSNRKLNIAQIGRTQRTQALQRYNLGFGMEQGQAMALQFREARRGHQLRPAWAGEVEPDLFDDASRPRAHDQNTICQEQRFIDVVRDEQDGGLNAGPDFQ